MEREKQFNDGEERRRAFRVDDEVHMEFRPIDDDASIEGDQQQTCRSLMQLRELSSQSGHILASIRKHSSEIAQYLAILDKKIDAVAQIAGAMSLGQEIQPNLRVNISAGGLAFGHHKAIPEGQRLSMRIVLFPSFICIQPAGRVVYCRERPQASADNRYRLGVEFEPLPEQEQDQLIRHLLEKQSAQRRKERHLE